MTKRKAVVAIGIAILAVGLPTVGAFVLTAHLSLLSQVDSRKILAVASAHPNFTLEQRQAVAAEITAEIHPTWQSLSPSRRVARLASLAARLLTSNAASPPSSTQGTANFVGNQTAITNPSFGFIALQRQQNCALSLYEGGYSSGTVFSVQVNNTTSNFELALHNAAGLATRADLFPNGCTDASTGISARRAVNLGSTAPNQFLIALPLYDFSIGNQELFTVNANATSMSTQTLSVNLSMPGVTALATGDLNGDGTLDIVGFNPTAGSIMVSLVSANGTIGAVTPYSVPGTITEALVLADVNGDGRLDAIVATANGSGQESISVLTGKGDGTFNAAQTFTVATPSAPSGGTPQIVNLITADLRGSGHQDIIGSNGIVLLNNGSGHFTATSAAFSPLRATSSNGPNLATADFNHDGRLDLAVDDGGQINIYLGRGDGTFTPGSSYASIGNIGYLVATDLDGDGNVDLYSGLGNDGGYSGDNFGVGTAYALMGNGDGSFRGSSALPFAYTGNNIVDLTGNGILDGIGVNSSGSFTTYLGNGQGGFTTGPSLNFSPVTIGGVQYTPALDSYALGDINGDGIPDLAWIAPTLNGIPNDSDGTGVFIALGDGHGGFGTPSFYALPAVPSSISGAYTIYPTISNLHLADVNHDGKADLIYYYTYDYQNASNVAYTNAGTAIQLGNGNGTFKPAQLIPFYSGPDLLYSESNGTSIGIPYRTGVSVVTDLNNDGHLDLVFIADTQYTTQTPYSSVPAIQVALGHGDGTFSTPTTVAGPTLVQKPSSSAFPAPLVVADMNGDGIPDIIAMGSNSDSNVQVAIALGNGNGTFKAPLLTNYTAQFLNDYQGLAVADFDGDGKLDIALTDPYDSTGSGISLGNGDGTLQTWSANGVVLPNLAINLNVSGAPYAGDLNGDGKVDLLAGNELLVAQAPVTLAPAVATYSAGQATLPTVFIGGAAFTNMVVTISKVTGAPTGTAPASGAIVYDPSTGNVTVPEVTLGANTYYNAVAAVGGLVSVSGVSGADTYDGRYLTISAVSVGGVVYRNVVVTPGSILGSAGGMPKVPFDQYTPSSKSLLIPAVEYNGKVYTNVTITVGTIISVNGAPP